MLVLSFSSLQQLLMTYLENFGKMLSKSKLRGHVYCSGCESSWTEIQALRWLAVPACWCVDPKTTQAHPSLAISVAAASPRHILIAAAGPKHIFMCSCAPDELEMAGISSSKYQLPAGTGSSKEVVEVERGSPSGG